MTEQQRYTVLQESDGFELRLYEPHVLAQVTVGGGFESAAFSSFRTLVSYIGGNNSGRAKIAMTAPVLQQSGSHGNDVAFVMPAGSNADDMPQPSDPSVTIRAVDSELVAAARYSGRWSQGSFDKHARQLQDRVTAAGFTPSGPPRFARFDPPWTPWFMRRNEVLLPVVRPQ